MVEDRVGNTETKGARVLVDTIYPQLNVVLPQNENYTRKVEFNITTSEKVNLDYRDNSEATPRWRNLCANCNDYGNSIKKVLQFKAGAHGLTIRATDKAGNFVTITRSFNSA
jgi:hypothetical protein